MLYLASPYSHPDPLIRKTRFLLAEQVTAQLLIRRQWVYSPIVHCHELAMRHELPGDFEFWRDYNFAMLRRCERLIVLVIPGWSDSAGVKGEMELARTLRMDIAPINESGEGFLYDIKWSKAQREMFGE